MLTSDKPVAEYAKSSVYVARYHVEHGGRDLALAKELLEPIASSNAEEVTQATDLLKKTRAALAKMQAEAAQTQAQALTQAQHGPAGGSASQAGGV